MFDCITATMVAATDAGDIGEVMATLVRRVAYQPSHSAFLAGQAGHGARPVVRGDARDLVRDTADDPAKLGEYGVRVGVGVTEATRP